MHTLWVTHLMVFVFPKPKASVKLTAVEHFEKSNYFTYVQMNFTETKQEVKTMLKSSHNITQTAYLC